MPFQNEAKKRLYLVWYQMKHRCEDKGNKDYLSYGQRGIRVADEWQSFQNFYEWSLQNGYEPKLQLDRIDNNGDYSPQNCRFVSRHQQQSNKRNNTRTPGVSRDKNLYVARLEKDGILVFDKCYKTEAEAIRARKSAELQYLGYLVQNDSIMERNAVFLSYF